jgi:hypothetical protein
MKWTPRAGTKNSQREYIPERSPVGDEKAKRIYDTVEGKNLFTGFDREQNDSPSLSGASTK